MTECRDGNGKKIKMMYFEKAIENYAKKHRCVAGSKESMECVNKRHKNYVPKWR